MSTREIAELTGKEHFHVLRDFRDMCEALELIESSFGCNYKDSIGRTLPLFKLPNDLTFAFRADGYFNMTKAAGHFGKRLDNFFANDETLIYVDALGQIPGKAGIWIETKRGNGGGTCAHPKLAVFFARWLDLRFAVWCDATMEHSPQLDLGRRQIKQGNGGGIDFN